MYVFFPPKNNQKTPNSLLLAVFYDRNPGHPVLDFRRFLPSGYQAPAEDGTGAKVLVVGGAKLSNEKNPGYLLYMGDYTTQLYRDYNKPL